MHSLLKENIMREKGFKEDSTKGKARMIPVNYKGDVIVQAWLDARKLLVLSRWLDKGGYNTQNLSNIIKFTVDEIVEQLISSGMEQKVEYTKDARTLLEDKYRCDLNPSGRGERNMVHNMRLDDIRKGNAYENEKGQIPASSTVEKDARSATEKALEEYRRMEKEGFPSDKKREAEGHEEAMEEYFKEHKVDEDGIVIVKTKSREENIEAGRIRAAEIARDNAEEAEAKAKAKKDRKDEKARKKEQVALDAMSVEYEERKKALAEANDKGNEYKPRSDEEVAEMNRKIDEEDAKLYAMDMSGPKPKDD